MMRAVFLSFWLPMITVVGLVLEEQEGGDIPRFAILDDGLYRGGQPTEKGFEFLKQKGIKTVINLRAEDNSEARTVERLGMHYFHIPVDEVRPWSEMPPGAIAKYFELVNNPDNYPIFFHCLRGADRTGALAAFYRMAVQHWDAKKAYEEARQIGMRWYFAGLKTQILAFQPPPRDELQPVLKKQ